MKDSAVTNTSNRFSFARRLCEKSAAGKEMVRHARNGCDPPNSVQKLSQGTMPAMHVGLDPARVWEAPPRN